MGDRNNPIKFGPEWLRNLARERSAGGSAGNTQNVATTSGAAGGGAAVGGGSAGTAMPNTANSGNAHPKVQLAKLRYGREEMLALYDRTSEAPSELKYIDLLYQSRGKPPVALNNTFEDDMREALRSGPPIGGMPPGERFGMGRGMGRGVTVTEGRGRARLPFVRQLSAGRGTSWHLGAPRMPGYSGGADDDSALALRSWNSSNGSNVAARNSGDQAEWAPNKMFRSKRPGSSTNWRTPARDEGDEWRSADTSRARSSQQEKWERDWGDRPGQEKPQSWNTNRRTWVGGDTQNHEDNLPEWAMENAEAGGGTFDSSGAFHGYSNDDTNLPKSQESAYQLTRSHTHGSFVRSKTVEEGSEEWWASEKAKKLSPKRFDASDLKFKKPSTGNADVSPSTSSSTKATSNKEDTLYKAQEKTPPAAEPPENQNTSVEDSFNKKNVRFAESKTFDALMRSDINLEEANDDRGNFQSVMITPNNSLRQKHQNIVASVNNTNRQNHKRGILQLIQSKQTKQSPEGELSKHLTPEDKIVDNIMELSLDDKEMHTNLPVATGSSLLPNPPTSVMSSGMSTAVNSLSQMSNPVMHLRMPSPGLPNQGMVINAKSNMTPTGMQADMRIQTSGIQPVGITNSALNASLGLPLGPNNVIGQPMGIPLQGVPPPILPNQGMGNPIMGGLQTAGPGGIPTFQSSGSISGMSGPNIGNSSLFLGQNPNNSQLQSNDIQMPNHSNQTNMFPMHGLQHSGSQGSFGSSIYGNIMQQSSAPTTPNTSLAEQWYYEDPKKIIQGPFSSKDMYNWFRAGFFSPSLMVRRACDALMRPLGSYGHMVPFAQMDMMSSFPMSGGYEGRSQGAHESMLNSQQSLGLDVMNMSNMDPNTMESMQFGTVGLMRNPPYGQQQMDSLWSQPPPNPELMWMQQALNQRNETRVNNLPMFFWDQQPSAIASNSLLPEEIAKEMKTEDQILAQLRASQNVGTPQNMPFMNEPPVVAPMSANKPEDSFISHVDTAPNLEELQKFMQEDTLKDVPITENTVEIQIKAEKIPQAEETKDELNNVKPQQQDQNKVTTEAKALKQAKGETDKFVKNKENNNMKTKNKKTKEEKKEELLEVKSKVEDAYKTEKRSAEASPTKSKKDEKLNKKEMEKEKKEWIKEGFTLVKGPEKNTNKDNKKKAEEVKAFEEAERKRKEEEKMAAEEDKKRQQAETLRKEQESQQLNRVVPESATKKAPWSAVTNQALQATTKEGITLAEIQRLEREKKLEQMKEQQQMMQIIAQQQAAALAREQEMQAGLGWAKKKGASYNTPGQSLAEIQAEARKQASAAAAPQAPEEPPAAPPTQANHVPWGNTHNGGGFWDTQPNQPQKAQESPKIAEPNKNKKKITLNIPAKSESAPAVEFESWCTSVLTLWSSKIDVPTFVGFLKDIESPYEVKDYVKYYLGDSKDSNDFARQFLERRSKLLRVGMVTPSDDLCSPAMAVNPRTNSGSDYQEVKGKGKKTKKNKMLKVDARILGFSVTAAEDRINVGDIDSV